MQGVERAAESLRKEIRQLSPEEQGRLMQTSRQTKRELKQIIMKHLENAIWWSDLSPDHREKVIRTMEAALDFLQQKAPNVVTLFIMSVAQSQATAQTS